VLLTQLRHEALVAFLVPGLGAVFALIRAAADRIWSELIGGAWCLGRGAAQSHPVVRTVYGASEFREVSFSQSNAFRKV